MTSPSGRPLLHLTPEQAKAWAKRALAGTAGTQYPPAVWLRAHGIEDERLQAVLRALEEM